MTLAAALAILALHAPLPAGVAVHQQPCPDYSHVRVNCAHPGDPSVYVDSAMKTDGGQLEWLTALAHEEGHVWDYQHLDDSARERYAALIHRDGMRWLAPSHWFAQVPPGEQFADTYALCAIGHWRRQVYTYGRRFYYGEYGELIPRRIVAATCWLLAHPPA